MKTVTVPLACHHIAPDGSEIRELIENRYGGLAHCRLPAGKISEAVKHKTVSELWYVLPGRGQLWRQSEEQEKMDDLKPGVSADIPVGTAFQFANLGKRDLVILIVTTPVWPGADESMSVQGPWDSLYGS